MAGTETATRGARRRLRHRVPTWVLFVTLAIGIAVLLRPVAYDLYGMYRNSQAIDSVTSVYDDAESPDRLAILANARAYNARLAGYVDPWLGGTGDASDVEAPQRGVTDLPAVAPSDIWPYQRQLLYTEGDIAGWIEAPEASIRQPIYLGATDQNLSAGAAHMEGTSLPVGGTSSRSVITGHSGLQTDRMFDDIRRLEPGDLFAIHTLGDTYTYEVTTIETCLPEEVPDHIRVEDGQDLVTLMTCTPYHVNSHRLLVTGRRTTRQLVEPTAAEAAVTYATNPRTLPLLAGVALAAVAIVATAVAARRRKARHG